MNELLLFLLKSTLVSGVLYAWYMLALRNRRLHNYNRFFLLFILYVSIQLPLLNFKWSAVLETRPGILTSANILLHTLDNTGDMQQVAEQPTTAYHIDRQTIVMGIAAAISLFLLLTWLIRISWIWRTGKKYPTNFVEGVMLVHTDLPRAPFSFMNRIYWREGISPYTGSGRMIFLHELAHIRQRHTYDKLACQLPTCIFWMNPFYWLILKELGMVHEFIADEHAMQASDSGMHEEGYTEAFARMLLHVHGRADYFTPEHQFFSSPIKRRLVMLQKNKTVRASVLRRLAVLPLVAGCIFIFAFSPKNPPVGGSIKADKKIVLVVDAGHGGKDAGCHSGSLAEKDLTLKVAKRMRELAPAYNIEIHLTRSSDKYLALEERVAYSNKLNPDGFITLHVDDQPGKETGKGTFGIAVNDKNARAEASKQLAYAVYKNTLRPEWEQGGAPLEKSAYVLAKTTSAAMLIELGDIKNKEQMQHIQDDTKLDELCSRILEGIVEAHKR